jgi:phosphocarrier protein
MAGTTQAGCRKKGLAGESFCDLRESARMVARDAIVRNGYGIHCRPSGLIAKAAQAYDGEVRVKGPDGHEADAKSVLALMGLGIHCGDRVRISVSGPDEESVCGDFVGRFEQLYDFERD